MAVNIGNGAKVERGSLFVGGEAKWTTSIERVTPHTFEFLNLILMNESCSTNHQACLNSRAYTL